MTSPQKLYNADYFSAYGDDPKRAEMYRQEIARIETLIPDFDKRHRILDYGCGIGDFLQMFPDTWTKHGIEVSDHAREIAASKGITVHPYKYRYDYYDVVVFRGTIQHLDNPLTVISECVERLRPGGYMIFLATPNTDSIVYRLFGDLPALDPAYNYVTFGERELCNILRHVGMVITDIELPYHGTPYADTWDWFKFIGKLLGFKYNFAWPGNMMEVYAMKRKPIADLCFRDDDGLPVKIGEVKSIMTVTDKPPWEMAEHPEAGEHPMVHDFATNDPEQPIVRVVDDELNGD